MARGKPLSEAERAKRDAEKAKKFKELGTKRLNAALDKMRMLIPLSNKAQYSYTPEQVTKLTGALEEMLKNVKNAYSGEKVSSGGVEL